MREKQSKDGDLFSPDVTSIIEPPMAFYGIPFVREFPLYLSMEISKKDIIIFV